MLACGHRFSKQPKPGSPRGILDTVNSSAMGTQACVGPNPCRENKTAPWLVGRGVSKEALAWPQALLLPCSHEGRSSSCMKNASTCPSKGAWEDLLYALAWHTNHKQCRRGVCPASARQYISPGQSPNCVRLVHLSATWPTLLSWGKQILASLHFSVEHHCCRQVLKPWKEDKKPSQAGAALNWTKHNKWRSPTSLSWDLLDEAKQEKKLN